MYSRVYSAGIWGVDARLICVEADVTGGLPQFNMVGLLSSEVREAKDRVVRALSNSGIELPPRKITVNLSPAGMRKQGSGFDMPIALAILSAMGMIEDKALKDKMFVGELGLDGHINCINGILPAVLLAKDEGFGCIVVPAGNAFEGTVVDGISVCGVNSLEELIEGLRRDSLEKSEHIDLSREIEKAYYSEDTDFADIKGQIKAKRATQVAVAGFHNLLYIGPPGSGKSMMAQRIPTVLSRLDKDESLEISKIYSVMGLLTDNTLVLKRPFRAPHHSITGPALVGGNGSPRPGEITLAHRGVLFLDEAAEFKKDVIEMLRQPLEDKQVVISRAAGNAVFPCDFMLVMAMNPCRCGYYPDKQHCTCSRTDVDRYFGKIKGPVLDRIDICTGTSKLDIGDFDCQEGMNSEQMRAGIMQARKIQEERFMGTRIKFNSQMGRKELEKYCVLGDTQKAILDKAYEKYNMTARGYYKVLKVARTIADLEGKKDIARKHIIEAIGYRNKYEG